MAVLLLYFYLHISYMCMFKIIIISGIQIILSLSYIVIYISISFVESTPLEKTCVKFTDLGHLLYFTGE